MRKAVIFDFDGVVINSTEVQRQAFFESYKIAVGDGGVPSFEEFLRHSGDSLPNIFTKMNLPLEMVEPYREISRRKITEIKVYDGMRELLAELKENRYKCGLCTGKDRARTIEILDNADLFNYFDTLVCSDDVCNPKPHPESLVLCLTKLSASREDSVMVGDARNDILCAKSAGVKNIAVTWGDTDIEDLKKERPDYVVRSIVELKGCLFNLYNQNTRKGILSPQILPM
ncbi:HAD family hydrolase [Ruminiclostridium papyrosolvens]|uniref:Haloacid dehalogenase n=1 Tax=Ruminiclostridium papyrosolvens C7 TaxID=1330534 RepID=U4R1S4_9FIRM|nr:HAD-IA family hydrolase [Ruminiclostridium papyrosolvens]EPR10814.1 haloacid dehalogenase [Ruminiclostridium papyrosolvens C7]